MSCLIALNIWIDQFSGGNLVKDELVGRYLYNGFYQVDYIHIINGCPVDISTH